MARLVNSTALSLGMTQTPSSSPTIQSPGAMRDAADLDGHVDLAEALGLAGGRA